MDFKFSGRRGLYYEQATEPYFQDGLDGTRTSRTLPVSCAILYKWIAVFAGHTPQKASMKRVKEVRKASGPSAESRTEFPKSVLELQAKLKRLRAQIKKAGSMTEA